MRRWSIFVTLAAVTVGGCKSVREMISARPEVVADAQGQQLRVERLAKLMASIKGMPMSKEAADFVANVWVDYTLFTQAIAAGRNLTDSATTAASLWPDIAEARGVRWHDSLIARRVPLRPEVADSIYDANTVRILQHILIRLEPNAEPPARAAARKKADQVYARVKSGANFAQLAKQFSDDPGSKQDGGYLPAAPRGKWVTAFDSAGWTLEPGAITPIVESPFGYHIIRRPPAAEVRDRLLPFAREQVGARIDSVYLDSLATRKKLVVPSGAPSLIRKALADRNAAATSTEALATFEGGSVTVGYFLRWVGALGPSWLADLQTRPDSSLTQFVRLIAQNQILLAQADSAGVRLSPEEWASLQQRFRGQVDTLRMVLDVAGGDVADPATAAADRARVAALKLDAFFDRLAAGHSRPRPMPGQLAQVLREGATFSVNPAALERTIELAKQYKLAADSAQTAPVQKPVVPAPGAPPVGAAPGAKP
jgi:peptidyl-prolyl cis-trans isomerase D